MIWAIGLDDTDYPEGGCTTWHANQLEQILIKSGAKPIQRRLVRLWPFAVRRTRGNAAMALIVDINPDNQQQCIDSINTWFTTLVEEIKLNDESRHARPGLIICEEGQFDESIYWQCVRSEFSDLETIVNDPSVIHYLVSDLGTDGLIGAGAAVSWVPSDNSTFEGIAWRDSSKCGDIRNIPDNAITILENNHPNTFMNRDPTYNRGLISPRTPCPVLFGVRGRNIDATSNALNDLMKLDWMEKIVDYSIHITNQCTDDHLVAEIEATVLDIPQKNRGGHVTVNILTNSGSIPLISFKDGGLLNSTVADLLPGDRIIVLGLVSPDGHLHIERLKRLLSAPGCLIRPKCRCGGHLKSTGKSGNLRCKTCKNIEDSYWLARIRKSFDWVEPPPSSRRHLSRPVNMMN